MGARNRRQIGLEHHEDKLGDFSGSESEKSSSDSEAIASHG